MRRAATAWPRTVDEYIGAFPRDVQQLLRRVRAAVRRAAPRAQESISYRIPAFTLDGRLVYFAGFRSHIGMYPVTRAVREKLGTELSKYLGAKSKASLRFPLDRPVPYGFIQRFVKVRVQENRARAAAKRTSR